MEQANSCPNCSWLPGRGKGGEREDGRAGNTSRQTPSVSREAAGPGPGHTRQRGGPRRRGEPKEPRPPTDRPDPADGERSHRPTDAAASRGPRPERATPGRGETEEERAAGTAAPRRSGRQRGHGTGPGHLAGAGGATTLPEGEGGRTDATHIPGTPGTRGDTRAGGGEKRGDAAARSTSEAP